MDKYNDLGQILKTIFNDLSTILIKNYLCSTSSAMRKPPVHRSFRHAFRGIYLMLRSERNFQLEMLAFLVNLLLIVVLKVSTTEAAIIILTCFAVLSAEILNTAIERICDFCQPEYDERIRFIKDIAAGAVLILALGAVLIGILIYTPYFLG